MLVLRGILMPIPFTEREMYNAWTENLSASRQTPRSNPHRLLLFYAIECGLKTILMRRNGVNRTDYLCPEIAAAQHNINQLLDAVKAKQNLKLPKELKIKAIKDRRNQEDRKLNAGQVNQMWRYGGRLLSCKKESKQHQKDGNAKFEEFDDECLERKLIEISEWIKEELARS